MRSGRKRRGNHAYLSGAYRYESCVLMSGGMPAAKNEIAIDRMYADNNKLKVGDKLKIAGEELTVTGLVALPDYSCLFSDNSDMMFDAVKFGVGIMTEKGADAFGTTHLEYRYSWQYETAPKDDIEAKNMSEDFLEVLVKYGNVTGFIPAYSNQAITLPVKIWAVIRL